MKLPELQRLTEAADGNTAEIVQIVEAAEKEYAKVEAALADLRKITSKLPGVFKSQVYSGHIHNLDTPSEYALWVAIENVKDMYTLSREVREGRMALGHVKSTAKKYKPSVKK